MTRCCAAFDAAIAKAVRHERRTVPHRVIHLPEHDGATGWKRVVAVATLRYVELRRATGLGSDPDTALADFGRDSTRSLQDGTRSEVEVTTYQRLWNDLPARRRPDLLAGVDCTSLQVVREVRVKSRAKIHKCGGI